MGGQSNTDNGFNNGGPKQCDHASVNQVYCPTPTPTPTPTPPPPPPQTPEECQASGWYWNYAQLNCQQTPWYCDLMPEPCGQYDGGYWSFETCRCEYPDSPVVLDVSGDGFNLTGAVGGVNFDLTGDGVRERLAWTAAGSDDAWLALDRDDDGVINSGKELFGNFTPQPQPPPGQERNGFLALAEFDRPENGGDGDGLIGEQDAVFASLRLWRDANHDGVSAPGELHTPGALGLKSVELVYKESKRVDEHGNRFRYRAKVRDARGTKVGRWAWDVFLTRAP